MIAKHYSWTLEYVRSLDPDDYRAIVDDLNDLINKLNDRQTT